MDNFYDNLASTLNKSEHNQILTDNGAIVYASAGNRLVDFSYAATSLRNKSVENIMALFEQCYKDNPLMAVKLMFQMGDVREGKGERKVFNSCLRYLALAHPEVAKAVLPLVPEYTRWDHVAEMVTCGNPSVQRFAKDFIAEQLKKDYAIAKQISRDGKKRPLTLCAKWVPKLGAKKEGHHKIALKIVQHMGITKKEYRKMCSEIMRHIGVVEQLLSANKAEEIDFERLTSAQQLRLSKTLAAKRGDDYKEYLDKVETGEAKMNSSVNTPASVAYQYCDTDCSKWGGPRVRPYHQPTELAWRNLKKTDKGSGVIVVRDDSGSMTAEVGKDTKMQCIHVATALAIYCAEQMQGPFKDKFISFSQHPKYLDMSGLGTLHDKLEYAYSHSEFSNTNIEATFQLLLDTAIQYNLSQDEIPRCVLILSDMEFDAQTRGSNGPVSAALFSSIRAQWKDAGYEMPTLAFWNLNSSRAVVPDIDSRGIILLSGFNADNLNLVLSGELASMTPEKQIAYILSSPRYDAVEAAFHEGIANEKSSGNVGHISFGKFLQTHEHATGSTQTNVDSHDEWGDDEWDDEYSDID